MEKNNCDCIFDSQKAYISTTKSSSDIIDSILIQDYLTNLELVKRIKEGTLHLICANGNELIKYESEIRKSHFQHKYCQGHEWHPMGEWHKHWQSLFPESEREVSIGERIADVVVGMNVLEFQHSKIVEEIVIARQENYKKHGKILNWIVDCNGSILVEKCDTGFLIIFQSDFWKYENFKSHDFIFLNVGDSIFKINPSKVKMHMIVVNEEKTRDEFVNAMMNNDLKFWKDEVKTNCTIYHKQRGAGSGKTFESIQILDSPNFCYEFVLYLTKLHTAKDVILQELKSQLSNGLVENLEEMESNLSGKQYVFQFKRKDSGKVIYVIVGTIDSFIWAVADSKERGRDYFIELTKSIQKGFHKISNDGRIKYANASPKLNLRSLILIDEAQDLPSDYIEALISIIKITNVDVMTIGDKLQSLWCEQNTHTFLEKMDIDHISIQRDIGKNVVRRFHNRQFIDLINTVIPFEEFNLPKIEGICDIQCKYKHEDDICPYHLFQIKNTFDKTHTDILNDIEFIITKMEEEIQRYHYLPNNFMFIFPILKNNTFANMLESRLQDFWVKKFNDEDYQNIAKKNSPFWSKILSEANLPYFKFVYLHKHDEGKSINLVESENSTRIVSIHSSKGNGCEVVFLFDVNEARLNHFAHGSKLIYTSLLNVALTRQKKKLYMGIECNGDDIHGRFLSFEIEKNIEIETKLQLKSSIKFDQISNLALGKYFEKIDSQIIIPGMYETSIPKNDQNGIIDWGHHVIRYAVLFYNFIANIVNDNVLLDHKDQFTTILWKISNHNVSIESYFYDDYMKNLWKINHARKQNKDVYHIPLLKFDSKFKFEYDRYTDYLKQIMTHIQEKIRLSLKDNCCPILCPLETIVFQHMKSVKDKGKFCDPTIMTVYDIIYCYETCADEIDESHQTLGCLCSKMFQTGYFHDGKRYHEIRQSIKCHYEKLKWIDEMYFNFITYVESKLSIDKLSYNQHLFVSFKKDQNFNLYREFELIANSEQYVIIFYFKPQYNKLNFYELMFKIIFDTFLIENMDQKHSEKNYEKFHNKKIIACILTLDTTQPIFYEMDLKKHKPLFIDVVKDFLYSKYHIHHSVIFDLYQYCKSIKPQGKTSFGFTYEKLVEKYEHIPFYVKDYFNDINKLSTDEQRKIAIHFNDKSFVENELDRKLDIAIKNYLDLGPKEEFDF
jgi:hypothetical protein